VEPSRGSLLHGWTRGGSDCHPTAATFLSWDGPLMGPGTGTFSPSTRTRHGLPELALLFSRPQRESTHPEEALQLSADFRVRC
jgi:hypothetical protein